MLSNGVMSNCIIFKPAKVTICLQNLIFFVIYYNAILGTELLIVSCMKKCLFNAAVSYPDSKDTELGSSNQEASPSGSKNTGIVLVPCSAWRCVPTAISGGGIFLGSLGVICYNRCVLSGGHKNYL